MNEQWHRWDASGGIIQTNSGSDGMDTSGGIKRTNSGSDGMQVVASYERTVAAMGCHWWYHTNEQWQRWDASGGII